MKKLILFTILCSVFACESKPEIKNTPGESQKNEIQSPTKPEVKLAPGDKARAMIKDGAMFIDVRTPGEFSRKALPGAVNIPISELSKHIGEFTPGASIVVYCAVGSRSGAAKRMLEKKGFKVFNMGGIRDWK